MDFKSILSHADPRLSTATKKTAPLYELQNPFQGKTMAGLCYQVYDADTCRVAVDIDGKLVSFKCRLRHFDSAEMKPSKLNADGSKRSQADIKMEKHMAVLAKTRAKELIDGKVCVVVCGEYDRYNRVLTEVFTPTGEGVHEVILREKLAYAYEGHNKNHDWEQLFQEHQQLPNRELP